MGTYAEARVEYCSVMGEELGSAYHLLWNQFALLNIRWEEYVDVFGTSQAEFDVMNKVAPGFFNAVQDISWQNILLRLAKFADPAKVANRRTLSLEALLTMKKSEMVPDLKQLIDTAKASIKFAQDWRHRYIAHTDLEHAFDKTVKPLASASRLNVREAMLTIHSVLDAVDRRFTGTTTVFEGAGSFGGKVLLRELRLVTRLRAERKERMEAGNPTPDDLDFKKWH